MAANKATTRWIIYTLLLVLRFYGAYYNNSQLGYIHPDEFFQGGQELFFGCQRRRWQPERQPSQHQDTSVDSDDLSHEKKMIDNKKYKDNSNMRNKYIVTNIPWEFEPQNALRSIVPPAFMTLLPLRVYTTLLLLRHYNFTTMHMSQQQLQLTGRDILIIPRLFMTLLSVLFLDGCLWALLSVTKKKKLTSNTSKEDSGGPPMEVIVLASSWPTLVMATRPFTNSLEAMAISILLLIVATDHRHYMSIINNNNNESRKFSLQHQNQLTIPLLVGMVCSIGLFVRFTFAFFALPIVLLFLYNRWRVIGANSWKDFVWNKVVLSLALSFLATSLLFTTVDWYYYHYLSPGRDHYVTACTDWSCHRNEFLASVSMYIVPWNAFRYNSKAANLAEHGLHPRITHLLVNMPMMFGPLSLIGYYLSCINIKEEFSNFFPSSFGNETLFRRVLCQSTIISGLLVLSCAPHQEPRFLLPCIVPLVFLHGRQVVGGINDKHSHFKKKNMASLTSTLWVVYNIILYLLFGWVHQGGMIPSLLDLKLAVNQNESPSPQTVIYYKTYMPPTFLTRVRGRNNENMEKENYLCSPYNDRICVSDDGDISIACENQVIIDLQGRDKEVLLEVLEESLSCQQSADNSLLLVTPASVMVSLAGKGMNWYTFLSIHGHGPHLSTEDLPESDSAIQRLAGRLELVTYNVSCRAMDE
jgi:phosphatidylinositol glycan class Z